MIVDVVVRQEDPGQPDIVALLRNGEADSAALYPPESIYHLPLAALQAHHVRFLVARGSDGRPLATGALVLNSDWAEIKRMWVEEHARGRGLSRRILETLIETARAESVPVVRLETGVVSHAAIHLYESAGFRRRGPFADYPPDPLSVFMERFL